MKQYLQACFTVARRDFMAIVATPSFLLFLLAPLLFVAIGAASAVGTKNLAASGEEKPRILAILPADELMLLKQADDELRKSLGPQHLPHRIQFETPSPSQADMGEYFQQNGSALYSLLHGSLNQPIIMQRQEISSSGQYLTLLVQQAARLRDQGPSTTIVPQRMIIAFPLKANDSNQSRAAKAISLGTITIIFMLTLLLATQSISSIAEEKSNKVIEILAAAVPLESVFMGKLLAMLGVGLLFVAFWGAVLAFGGVAFGIWIGSDAQILSQAANNSDLSSLKDFAPAVGWQAFIALSVIYMVMNFLLYGSLFLGIGSLAATTREIQMLSFPITMLQMIAYFVPLANFSAEGESPIQRFSEIFPFTSPYAMVAKAAQDESLFWHFITIGWQMIWVAIMIFISVRLFRAGVLGGEQAWKFWKQSNG